MNKANEARRNLARPGTHGHELSVERGQEARELREAYGITRPILSDLIGKSERTLYRWETYGITEENFQLIEEAIDASKSARSGAASGLSQLSLEALRTVSTLDLALELVARARKLEERNRRFDLFKEDLAARGLDNLVPEGL